MTVELIDAAGHDVPGDCDDFLSALRGPVMFHLRGRDRSRTRVVAGALHGNEPSGLRAIHAALAAKIEPATDVLFFLGAVDAARAEPRFSHRMLPGRRDLNRCFRPPFDGPEGRVAEQALRLLRASAPEAVIDLHNNSGRNPAYGIGIRIDAARLELCGLFSSIYIASALNLGTFMEAFDGLAPTLTIECGQAGDVAADALACAGLQRFLQLERLDRAFVGRPRIRVFTDPVRVRLGQGLSLAFALAPEPAVHLTLDRELDRHNFETLAAGTRMAWVRPDAGWPLEARDAGGRDLSRELFAIDDGVLATRQTFTPVMITTDAAAAREDCLFYAVHQRE